MVDIRQMLQHLSNEGEAAVSVWSRFKRLCNEETGCGAYLVHLAARCGDADRVQLHGEEEPDQKQEVALL